MYRGFIQLPILLGIVAVTAMGGLFVHNQLQTDDTFGAPQASFQRNLYPFEDSTYTIGTSTRRWLAGHFDYASTTNFAIDGITGSTQCLEVDTNGLVSGSGAACGTGSGGSNPTSKWATSTPATDITPNDGQGVVMTNATATNATTTNLFSTTASSTNLFTTNLTFGGVTGSVWTDFCNTITGGAGLCDGDDATGSGLASYDAWTHPSAGKSATTSEIQITGGLLSTASTTIDSDILITGNATATNATTTNIFSTTASSTNLFSSLLTVGGNGLFVGSDRRVGIGTTTPTNALHVDGNVRAMDGFISGSDVETLTIGGSTFGSSIKVVDDTVDDLFQVITLRDSDFNVGAADVFGRSRGTINARTVVAENDIVATLLGVAYDGTDYERVASIDFTIDGTPGGGDMPGRILFYTTPDNSATLSERMRIDSAGLVTIANDLLITGNSTTTALFSTTASSTNLFSTTGNFTDLTVTNTITGNINTASALLANGGNCSSGNAPLGVDASGAVESCFDVWTEAENTSAGYTSNTGTVTSVAQTVPTGLTISGSPVTTSGTLAIALDSGYVIPLQSTLDGKLSLYDAWTHPIAGTSATTSVIHITGGLLSTASTTIDNNLLITGNSTTTNATTTNLYSTTASSTNLFSTLFYGGSLQSCTGSNKLIWTGGSFSCASDETGGSPAWGTITGTLSDQTDLQGELDAKQNTLTATFPQILTGATLSFGGLSTSTAAVVGNIPYFSGVNTFDNVATTTLTASSPLSLDNPVAKVGGSNSILTLDTSGAWSGTAGSLAANGGNCSAGNFPLGVDALGAVESCTDAWTEAENTTAAYIALTSLSATEPIRYNSGTGAFTWGGVATTSNPTAGNLYYSDGTNGLVPVATSSIVFNSPITTSGTAGYLVGGSGFTLDVDDILPADLASADFGDFTCNATDCSLDVAYVPQTTTLTIAGTAEQITSSAGAQDLSTNRTWTLSLPSHVKFPANFQATSATTTNATTTNLDITSLFTFNGVTGNAWTDFCTTITGSADLCDGSDDGGSGGLTSYDAWTHPSAGVSATTSSMIFTNASSTFTGDLNITGNSTTTNATSTNSYSTTASSTNLFSTSFYGGSLQSCESGNVLTWSGGSFGCATDATGSGTFPWDVLTGTNATSSALTIGTSTLPNARGATALTVTATSTDTLNLLQLIASTDSEVFAVDISGRASTTDLSASGVLYLANGTASLPSLAFSSDNDTGIYTGGTGEIWIANDGANTWKIKGTGDIESTLAGNSKIYAGGFNAGGDNEALPIYSFLNDSDTGMWNNASDVLSLGAGGVEFLTLTESTQDELVINEDGDDIDFRVEYSGGANAFFINGADGVASSSSLIVDTLGGSGTTCVQASASGLLSATGSGCGGGSGDPIAWDVGTTYNTPVNSTTTPIWFTGNGTWGMFASSTSVFDYATTTALTVDGTIYAPASFGGVGVIVNGIALDFDCSDIASTGLTCSGEQLTVDLGTAIDTTEITDDTIGFVDVDHTITLAGDPALASGQCFWGANGIVCEGATANTFEALFTVTDPTADRTYTFPNSSITVAGLASAMTGTFDGNNFAGGAIGAGDILYGASAGSIAELAGVATGNALISGGVSTAPSWGKIGLTTHISGTLGVGNGGTGLTTFGGTNHILYTTAADTLSSEAAFLYAPATDKLTVVNASTTALTASGYFSITPAATFAPTVAGQLGQDSTSSNLVGYDGTNAFVIGGATTTLYGFTFASTSPDFVSGGIVNMPSHYLAQTARSMWCKVDAGTSVQIFLSDGTNDTNTITCTTTGAFYSLTSNNSWTSGEAIRFEIGTVSGSVDYLSVNVLGYRTTD